MRDRTPPEITKHAEKYPLLRPIGSSIEGKVALVTGANRGIGKAIVNLFLKNGASKVYAAVRDVESAKTAFSAQLANQNYDCSHTETSGVGFVVPIQFDLSDPIQIEAIAKLATDVDVVVNNAGVLTRTGPLDGENTIKNLQFEMDVNVYGLIRLANDFAPILEKRDGKGVFVQVNSAASMRCAESRVSTYSASKAASFSITQALRQEMGLRGIHVVSVHPGPICTDMVADLPDLAKIAPPPSIVAECLVDALTGKYVSLSTTSSDDECIAFPPFLLFPDKKAKGLGHAYQSYSDIVIEQGKVYGNNT